MQPRNPADIIPGKYYNANPEMISALAAKPHHYLARYREHVHARASSNACTALAAYIVICFIVGVVLFVVTSEAPGTIMDPSFWMGLLFVGFFVLNVVTLAVVKLHAAMLIDAAVNFLKTPLETNRSESEYGNGLRFLEWLSSTHKDDIEKKRADKERAGQFSNREGA